MVKEKFKILSLDGGGVRGYLSAKILENIEEFLNKQDGTEKPLGERFDLIVGTSTGAIIAGMLALGKNAKDIRKLYENDIPTIFSPQMKRNIIARLFWSKYKPDALIQKAQNYFEDLTFNDVKTDLVITSVGITTMTPRFHKSDFAGKNGTRANEKLSNAIVASASAPAYFPVAKNLEHSDYLVDGGIVANNPAMVGITDALTFERDSKRGTKKPEHLENILLLSVGTGEQARISYDIDPLLNAGGMDWLIQFPLPFQYNLNTPLIEIIMASQANLVEFQARTLLEKSSGTYRRLNPKLGSTMKLDDVTSLSKLKNIHDLLAEDNDWLNTHFIGSEK